MENKTEERPKPSKATNTANQNVLNLDTILINELGQFGQFQLRAILLLAGLNIFLGWASTEYIFTTARIRTRCFIPECETTAEAVDLIPEWLLNAVPGSGDSFDGCNRFANSSALHSERDVCPSQLFDTNTVIPCEQFVYENTYSIVYEFDLGCDEWRQALIGSLRTVGVLVALPITGFISDRWGRRTALAIVAFNTAWIGALRYFADTYVGFLIAQMAESGFGGGGFACTYILVMEMVGPKYRVAASAMLSSFYAVGQVLTALIAWAVPYWRHLTLTLYIPQFLAILYFWIIPESIRWYLSKGRFEDAQRALKEMARVNKKQLSELSLLALKQSAEAEVERNKFEKEKKTKEPWLIVLVWQHKPILLRCIVIPVWWITNTLIYYGLTINSVNIAGNSYFNLMAVAAVEIPGFWAGMFLINTVGRKPTLMGAFWICSGCQLAYLFIPSDQYGASLAVYLVGKLAIAVVAMTVYVYTAELYPTRHRNRLLSFSSMVGRIGSIVAPLTPAFGEQVPFILFGSAALLAGLLVLLTPETRGSSFPDTMEEAARTGRKM